MRSYQCPKMLEAGWLSAAEVLMWEGQVWMSSISVPGRQPALFHQQFYFLGLPQLCSMLGSGGRILTML